MAVELLNWPVFVGGPADGEPWDPADWKYARIARLAPEAEVDSPTVGDRTVYYTELKLELISGELAIRFCLPESWEHGYRCQEAVRALVRRALPRRLDPSAESVVLIGYNWPHLLRGLLDDRGPARISGHPEDPHDMVLEWPAGQLVVMAPPTQHEPKRLELRVP